MLRLLLLMQRFLLKCLFIYYFYYFIYCIYVLESCASLHLSARVCLPSPPRSSKGFQRTYGVAFLVLRLLQLFTWEGVFLTTGVKLSLKFASPKELSTLKRSVCFERNRVYAVIKTGDSSPLLLFAMVSSVHLRELIFFIKNH